MKCVIWTAVQRWAITRLVVRDVAGVDWVAEHASDARGNPGLATSPTIPELVEFVRDGAATQYNGAFRYLTGRPAMRDATRILSQINDGDLSAASSAISASRWRPYWFQQQVALLVETRRPNRSFMRVIVMGDCPFQRPLAARGSAGPTCVAPLSQQC